VRIEWKTNGANPSRSESCSSGGEENEATDEDGFEEAEGEAEDDRGELELMKKND
jgi:hypothetical protein